MNKNIVETGTYEYKGCNVTWDYDECAKNPREWDNVSHMICWHRWCNIGDDHNYNETRTFFENLVMYNYDIPDDVIYEMSEKELYKKIKEIAVIMPISMYEHSGMSIWYGIPTGQWDSGQVGWGYMTKEEALKNLQCTEENWREVAKKQMENEMKTYSHYVAGDVFNYIVKDPDEDIVDSCIGCYGYQAIEDQTEEIHELIDDHMTKCQAVDRIWSAFAIE